MAEAKTKERPARVAEFDQERVRDISEAVYRDRLGDDLKGMLEKDADGGKKLRERAGSYDALTRSYMRAIKPAAAVWAVVLISSAASGAQPHEWIKTPQPTLARGVLATACPGDTIYRFGPEHGRLHDGICPTGAPPLVGIVTAIPGDRVEFTREIGMLVNGDPIPHSQPTNGRAAVLPGRYDLQIGQYWILSNEPNAVDSRYIGPVIDEEIVQTKIATEPGRKIL